MPVRGVLSAEELVVLEPVAGVAVFDVTGVSSVVAPLDCWTEIDGILEGEGVAGAGLDELYVPKIPNAAGQVGAAGLVGAVAVPEGVGCGLPAGADCAVTTALLVAMQKRKTINDVVFRIGMSFLQRVATPRQTYTRLITH
jgi:hypothetical protein